MREGDLIREHLETIAYCALWQLRDLDPAREPGYFRMTRLTLHDRLSDDVERAEGSDVASRDHLRLVPP